jgi:hypothetical protein
VLEQSSGELRRALEGAGVHLLRLDIGQSNTQSKDSGAGGTAADAGATNATSNDGSQAGEGEAVTHTVTLSNGALIDVLA